MVNPKIVVAPNGRNYACFTAWDDARKWAVNFPQFRRVHPVRVGNMIGFAL